jgi:4-hydroxybenzoate polyprenyltransferase
MFHKQQRRLSDMRALTQLKAYGGMVAFSHTIFALPFAASAVALATRQSGAQLTWQRVLAIVICMISARTAAMAFNRLVDRDVDAKNPRTKDRHIPSGAVSVLEGRLIVAVSSLLFLGAAYTLGFWPRVLALPVLLVLLGYSLAKRFTWAAHAWLGVALALAPGGAWLAVGAAPNAGIVALMFGVVTWLLGFDVLYSLQDESFDRDAGLHSIPARFGLRGALWISGAAHVLTAACFLATGYLLGRHWIFVAGAVLAACILAYEHWIVGAGDLKKINKAFFDMNAYVSVAFFLCALLDVIIYR